jgi:hypothetical protein
VVDACLPDFPLQKAVMLPLRIPLSFGGMAKVNLRKVIRVIQGL